jgi:DNA-binding SARP family transcriptional activator
MYRSEHDIPSPPVIRVYVFGEFALERLVSGTDEAGAAPRYERVGSDAWGGRGPAQALLKCLLCRHRRRAMKDELVEALWPEPEDEERDRHLKSAERACDAAASVLRNVLRIAGGESLLTTISSSDGTLYKLPDQHRLWTDADAFEALVDQALRATDAQEVLPVWEAAYRLAQRGEFLEDDRYRDWAVARRERLRGKIGECVYALADLYAAQQRADLARDLLWDAVTASPTDEDALYRLLLLLEQQGRYQAARQVYRRTQEVAEQDGLPLAPRVHALAKRIREQGARLEANPPGTMSTPLPFATVVSARAESFIPDLTPADEQHNALPLLSQAIAQGILTAMREIGGQEMDKLRRRLLGQAVGLTGAALFMPLDDFMHTDVLERLAHALKKPAQVDQSTLIHLESVTRKERQRFVTSEGADWYDLFCEASGHLNVLTRLLEQTQPTPTYTLLCTLASETTLLIGDMLFNAGQNDTSERYYTLALETAKEAHYDVLQAIILGRMSFIPIYRGTPDQALPFLEQARSLVSQNAVDIIPAWLWAIAAEAYANIGKAPACAHALEQAEWLLNRGRTGQVSLAFEENTAHALFGPLKLLAFQGTCFIRLRQLEEAQTVLHTHLDSLAATHLHHQSITLVDLGMTHALQADTKESCHCASRALSLVAQTGSGRVLQRAVHLRRELDPWKNTPSVRQLDEHLASVLQAEAFRGQL